MASGQAEGFAYMLIAILFFGTNYLPVKRFNTADGFFYQWMMCSSIMAFGILVQFFRDSPPFEPFAALGGVLWATGNLCAVPIIHCIGLGLGLLLWCGASLLFGWANGFFGLLGVSKQSVDIPALNICGVLLAVASMGAMFFVKTGKGEEEASSLPSSSSGLDASPSFTSPYESLLDEPINGPQKDAIITSGSALGISTSFVIQAPPVQSDVANPMDVFSKPTQRAIGLVLSLVSGCFYGVVLNPSTYLIDSGKGKSKVMLDYIPSHFTGIYLTSTIYFLLYCLVKKNKPLINAELILPSFLSGFMWCSAQTAWFAASEHLSMVITYPLSGTGPGIVGALCSVFLFKEIRGGKNLAVLVFAISLSVLGCVLITLSQVL